MTRPPTAVNSDDEEDIPHCSPGWSSIVPGTHKRQRLVYTYGWENQTNYPSQITTPLQETIYALAMLEEPMDNMINDMPDLIDIPKEVLFQNYLYPPWMWTHSNDAS